MVTASTARAGVAVCARRSVALSTDLAIVNLKAVFSVKPVQ